MAVVVLLFPTFIPSPSLLHPFPPIPSSLPAPSTPPLPPPPCSPTPAQLNPLLPSSTDLDCNAKFWRLIADILNDLANFLELLAPLFPSFFLPIVCSASVSKVRLHHWPTPAHLKYCRLLWGRLVEPRGQHSSSIKLGETTWPT